MRRTCRTSPLRASTVVAGALAIVSLGGCSDGKDLRDPVAAGSTVDVDSPGTPITGGDAQSPPVIGSTVGPDPSGSAETAAPATAPALETVPETGVPGLDSEDVFCAAWSRFGGTWQVLSVGSSFLDDPDVVASWEVAASQVVLDAFDALVASFPPELASERDVAIEGYFGVLRQRAADARRALAETGATDHQAADLGRAWVDALAARDQFDADVGLIVPDALRELVERAATELAAARGMFHLDPTMVVTVATPATDDYLAVSCPDQGALAGQEVDDSAGG